MFIGEEDTMSDSDLHENTNLEFKDNIMITYVQNINSSSSTSTKY